MVTVSSNACVVFPCLYICRHVYMYMYMCWPARINKRLVKSPENKNKQLKIVFFIYLLKNKWEIVSKPITQPIPRPHTPYIARYRVKPAPQRPNKAHRKTRNTKILYFIFHCLSLFSLYFTRFGYFLYVRADQLINSAIKTNIYKTNKRKKLK